MMPDNVGGASMYPQHKRESPPRRPLGTGCDISRNLPPSLSRNFPHGPRPNSAAAGRSSTDIGKSVPNLAKGQTGSRVVLARVAEFCRNSSSRRMENARHPRIQRPSRRRFGTPRSGTSSRHPPRALKAFSRHFLSNSKEASTAQAHCYISYGESYGWAGGRATIDDHGDTRKREPSASGKAPDTHCLNTLCGRCRHMKVVCGTRRAYEGVPHAHPPTQWRRKNREREREREGEEKERERCGTSGLQPVTVVVC